MQLRGRELRIDMQGEDVALLHEELMQLHFDIPENERIEAVFGQGTRDAVYTLQGQHRLERTGIVDERTAVLINQLVEDEHPQPDKPLVVRGTIVYADGKAFNEGLVRAYDKDLRREELLGESETDGQGRYEIHYGPVQFSRAEKDSADLLVRAMSRKGEEVAHSPILFNAQPEETIDLTVGNEVYRGPSEYEQLVETLKPVCQKVPFTELKEDREHQDISFLSGETGVDPQRISALASAHRFQQLTDLAAEVFYGLFREGMPTDLHAVLMQNSELLRLSLLQAVEENIIPIHFGEQIDKILDQLQGLIVHQALEQPVEEEKRTRVIDLLATVLEEGQQREFVSAYVAHKGPIKTFWQNLKARPEFQDRVPELQFTLQLSVLTRNHLPLIAELQRKRNEGDIATSSDLVRYSKDGWHDLIIGRQGAPVGFPPDVPGKDDDEKARNYARALANMMEDSFPTAFVSHRLEEDQLEGKEEILSFLRNNPQFDIKSTHLGTFLAENNNAVDGMAPEQQEVMKRQLSAIQRVYKVVPRYTQTSFLLGKGLDSAHAINRFGKKPLALMYGDALGSQMQAMEIANRSQQVADTAMALVPEIIPSLGISTRALGEISHKQIEGHPDWASLFGSLDLCDCEHCNSVYGPAAYLVDILHFLKARKLVEIQQNNKGEITSVKFKQKTLGGIQVDKSVQDLLFERRPDLAEIELTCENTKTPLPSVDLVNEILEDVIADPKDFASFTPSTALEIDLDQGIMSDGLRQTFKEKGFILDPQASVRVRKKGHWWTIDDLSFSYTIRKEGNQHKVTTRGRQTSGTREELEANPQYINLQAYDKLRTQVFPWLSPFDMWAEEARVYLDHLGVPRSVVMEAFLPGDRKTLLGHDDIAREYLGLTNPEANLITGATTSQPGANDPGEWNLWGFIHEKSGDIPDPADSTKWISLTNQQDWLDTLKGRVDVFLQQSGLKYKDLLDLLVTNNINPVTNTGQRTITIQSKDAKAQDTCELKQLKTDGLGKQIAVKIVRFIRLWRKLGCHLFDLDRVALAFGKASQQTPHITPPELDKSFLVRLSCVMRLHETLKVPIEELAAWWAPNIGDPNALCAWWSLTYIDHHAEGQPVLPSLYTRLFRNKNAINPLDPDFTENPADLKGKLSGHEGTITAALSISAEDVTLLDEAVIKGGDALSLDNLSELFRHARLAKALKLKIRDYLSVLAIYAGHPFSSPLETLMFIEHVGQIRASGFSVTELDYLLRHTAAAVTEAAPTDEEIAIFLGDIRSGLQTIAAENTFREEPTDPNGATVDLNGDLTCAKLAQLSWEGDLIDQVIATFNDADTYRAPLATLPAGLVLPNDTGNYEVPLAPSPVGNNWWNTVKSIVSYDQNAGKFQASHYLNPSERKILLAAASQDQSFDTALKSLFKQQDELQGKVSYDQEAKELRFFGVMTKVRKARLKDVPNTQEYALYKTAIDTLFESPRKFVRLNLQTFSLPVYTAKLDTLPAKVTFPVMLKKKVYYNKTVGKLHLQGAMTEKERDMLLALSTNQNAPNYAAYQATVKALFNEPSKGAHYTARLFDLPAGIIFPAAFQNKIYHDETERELHFRGEMTEAERNTLLALSTDPKDSNHAAYHAAVLYLFKVSAEDAFLAPADIDILFDNPTTAAKRFEYVLKKLLPRLRTTLGRRLVIQKLGEALGVENEAVEKLLTTWIEWRDHAGQKAIDAFLAISFAESDPNLTVEHTAFADQFETYTLLHKIALVILILELTPKQLRWLFEYGPAVGWPDMNQLPLSATKPPDSKVLETWERLWRLCQVRDKLPRGENLLDKLFATAAGVPATASGKEKDTAKTAFINLLTKALEWTEGNLDSLVGYKDDHTEKGLLNVGFPAAFRDEQLLWRLQDCFSVLKRLGMSAGQCAQLSKADVTNNVARNVRQAVRAKYEDAQWLKLAKPLRDVLREKQRAALVAYLLAHPGKDHPWRKVSDIYSYFLIDVEMSPCQITSRIRQATLSVQLFVQRCLMHLEPEVLAAEGVDEKWREWKWMKNYRVWEANRKVFLYPENWIEPELRDDKSPFFKALESELMQSDLTKETAEEAFHAYLEKLDQVARLEIVGMHHQVEKDLTGQTSVDILHVFGRTHAIPHVYYCRQLVDGKEWTAWERIDLDIEGDHLIPVMWNRRLYLFWPTFTEKAKPLQAKMPKEGESFAGEPEKYWEIKLAWSERKQGKWTNKRLSGKSVNVPVDSGYTDDPSMFFFRGLTDYKNNLYILVFHTDNTLAISNYSIDEQTLYQLEERGYSDHFLKEYPNPPEVEAFFFVGCESTPRTKGVSILELIGTFGMDPVFDVLYWPNLTTPEYMLFRETDFAKDHLYLPAPTDTPALKKTPGTFLLLPHTDGKSIAEHPFFFQDDKRIFFVIPPEKQWTVSKVNSEDETDPGASEIFLPPELLYEIPPVKDLLGPIIDIVDPPPFESSVPFGPGPFASASAGAALHLIPSPGSLGMYTMAETGPGTGMLPRAETYAGSSSVGWWGKRPFYKSFVPMFREVKGYKFETFYHPYVCSFVKELNAHGMDGLLHRPLQLKPYLFLPEPPSGSLPKPLNFKEEYGPEEVKNPIVITPYPEEDVDFSYQGGYALYNWELFFHTPFLIANRLSKNQRFEEAQKWFHYIFDPTDTSALPKPQRYWRMKHFFETTDEKYQKERIQNLLCLLAKGEKGEKEYDELVGQVQKWRKHPFKPHLIARLRTTAYQKSVVMKYIDNLIAWGDQLFCRDTMESINEATQLYILAADLLGKRPEEIPPRAIPTIHTYKTLEPKLDEFSNALVQIEGFIPPSAVGGSVSGGKEPPVTLPAMLYFCVPKNKKLLGYWDTVADRLFKIRHCMNIEGVVRQLPLFAPPIEPGLLVKAAAAGVDISSALNDINAPLPYYRFNVMIQKALELCAEVKSLGTAMLSALEKMDAEDLVLLRAGHEAALLKRVEQVKKDQIEEAKESIAALRKSRDTIIARYVHYQKLLGVKSPQLPAEGDAVPDNPPSPHVSIKEEGGVKMIPHEQHEMDKLEESHEDQGKAGWTEFAASIAHTAPNFSIKPWWIGFSFGGSNLGAAISAIANRFRSDATDSNFEANLSAKLSQYSLRAHDWTLHNNQAAREIMHIDKQILAAEIRKAITERELDNHKKQIEQAEEIEQFMKDKYTNRELYSWMIGQISSIYFQAYQLAYDVAKRAERTYRHELGLNDSDFIQFGYWDSLKKGLLSGEQLHQDIKRMEVAYLDKNRREYEITKHVSLLQVDPLALVQLRTTGSCEASLPEELFDIEGPGHYFRRIKNVAITIPCVTGPYAGVNCKLTLLKSSIRRLPTASGDYARGEENNRFIDYLGSTESIVASTGQNDNGLFETNLRDERYLPFEGSGAISKWRLELPANPSAGEPQQFDYDTISDVVIHLQYTARDGGSTLRQAALNHFKEAVNKGSASGMMRLFSVRHEFPTEWAKFLNQKPGDKCYELALTLCPEHYPFWSQGRLNNIVEVDLFAQSTIDRDTITVYDRADKGDPQAKHDDLDKDISLKDLVAGKLTNVTKPAKPVGQFKLYFEDAKLIDLWIAIAWSG
jgi:hypothetical protein